MIGRQLLRCGTGVASNYRAACRGKSTADIIAKLGIVEEEADETIYWLELLSDSGLVASTRIEDLLAETNEIVAMTVASIKTLRSRNGAAPASPRARIPLSQSKIANPKSKMGA